MKINLTEAQFLQANKVAQETWEKANISWDALEAIAADYMSRQSELTRTAEFCAKVVQALPGVHSVRWRLKEVEHLLEKIVRKKAAGGESNKYLSVDAANYHTIVTDLVGIRALHLFKEECFGIDASLREAFDLLEGEEPVAYTRVGDPPELLERFRAAGLQIKEHEAGYRSVHYVVVSRPLRRKVAVEVQVRTIFEEGWSEIDHKIRYPNFSNNQQVAYFLRIFNGLAGSADEMGSFVRGLDETLRVNERQAVEASQKHEQILVQLENAVAELTAAREKSATTAAAAEKLKREIAALRAASEEATAAAAREINWLAQPRIPQVGGFGTEAQRLAFLGSAAGLPMGSAGGGIQFGGHSAKSIAESVSKSVGLEAPWNAANPLKK